jgi:hypothetical protein
MSMHNLPGAIFRSKDHRSPQSEWGDVLSFANLGLCPLDLYNVGKLRSYVPLYDLEANHLAISELRYGTLCDEICSKVVDRGFLEERGVPSPVTWKKRRHTDAKDTPRR